MTMKWLAFLVLGCASPAVAQEAEVVNFRTMSDAELLERATAVINTGFYNACNNESPLFAELARRNPTHLGYKSATLLAQAICADVEGRPEEALELVRQSERVLPIPIQNTVGLNLAIQLKDGPEALARLRKIAAEGRTRYLDPDFLFAGINTASSAGLGDELDQLAYELTATSEFAQIDPDVQGAFAIRGVRHAVKLDDLSSVDRLLDYISYPPAYIDMLSDRTYEAAWPRIEARVGEHLEAITSRFVARSAERLTERPEDRDRLSSYAHALHFAGRFQEAIDVARNWRPDRQSLTDLDEGDGWSLNIEAYALDALGRIGEADAVFDQLATLPPDKYPWVVNFVINRASRLVGQRRWEEGLAATVLARSVAEKYGSTYAKMLIARDRACALQELGRPGEAEPEIAYLREHFNDSAEPAVSGLLCAGLREETETRLAGAMEDEAARAGFIRDLQDDRFELFYTPSALPDVRDAVLASDGLREKALTYIRFVPEQFVPVAYLRREAAGS